MTVNKDRRISGPALLMRVALGSLVVAGVFVYALVLVFAL